MSKKVMEVRRVYYIRCVDSDLVWAHNHWAARTAVPSLYMVKQQAQTQLDSGKAGVIAAHCALNPEVKEAELILTP